MDEELNLEEAAPEQSPDEAAAFLGIANRLLKSVAIPNGGMGVSMPQEGTETSMQDQTPPEMGEQPQAQQEVEPAEAEMVQEEPEEDNEALIEGIVEERVSKIKRELEKKMEKDIKKIRKEVMKALDEED